MSCRRGWDLTFDQQSAGQILAIISEEFIELRREVTKLIRTVDQALLADGFMSLFEGAFILSKSLCEADITLRRVWLYRTLPEALFLPD